jgi:hypothetical protein
MDVPAVLAAELGAVMGHGFDFGRAQAHIAFMQL